MSTIHKSLFETIKIYTSILNDLAGHSERAEEIFGNLIFTSEVSINCYGGPIWLFVSNREDLSLAMSVLKEGNWTKSVSGIHMVYSAVVDDVHVSIYAKGDALPPTCHEVEEEVEIPAQPARIEKRTVIKCNVREEFLATPSDVSNNQNVSE